MALLASPTSHSARQISCWKAWTWQERGCGIVPSLSRCHCGEPCIALPLPEVHINRHKKTRAARLVMRMRGVLKLLLNTPVFPTTRRCVSSGPWQPRCMRDRYEMVGQKSVRFVGVDADTHEAKSEKARSSACCVTPCPACRAKFYMNKA